MKTRISILLIVVGLLAVSCDGDFLDVNTDPNNPTETTPDLILPQGLDYTATYMQEFGGLNHLGNMMMFTFGESMGFSWYDTEFRYSVTSTFYDNLFDDAYADALKQYQVLANSDAGYYKAIGEIMKAYHFQILVDLYGDVPYSEALQRGANSTPKYDKADVIYDDLLTKLTGAIATIDSTANTSTPVVVGNDDTIFGGDMAKWKAFANTIKIRILSRLSNTKGAQFINDQLSTIQSSGAGYISDDVTIDPGYAVQADQQNPYWEDLGKDVSGSETLSYQATCATQFVIDQFQTKGDPRLDAIFETPSGGHNGINQGAPNDDEATQAPPAVSNLKFGGGVLKSATMPSVIFTEAEHHFNMAELAQRGLNVSGNARAHYEAGITASFEYLGLSATDAQNYYTNNNRNVDWDNSPDKMDAIMTQQWLGTMGLTAEQAWFDYNRTGYPTGQNSGVSPAAPGSGFPISELAGSHDDRPVRLAYPSSESSRNAGNMPDQPNAFSDKIFWAN